MALAGPMPGGGGWGGREKVMTVARRRPQTRPSPRYPGRTPWEPIPSWRVRVRHVAQCQHWRRTMSMALAVVAVGSNTHLDISLGAHLHDETQKKKSPQAPPAPGPPLPSTARPHPGHACASGCDPKRAPQDAPWVRRAGDHPPLSPHARQTARGARCRHLTGTGQKYKLSQPSPRQRRPSVPTATDAPCTP